MIQIQNPKPVWFIENWDFVFIGIWSLEFEIS